MTFAKLRSKPSILAIEGSVADRVYPAISDNEELKMQFFSQLKELLAADPSAVQTLKENPRAGDNILILAEDFDAALIRFGKQNGLMEEAAAGTQEEQADSVAKQLFGEYKLKAGGSLANSFDAMVNSKINGESLVNGTFVTAVGEGENGQVFLDSLQGNIAAAVKDRQILAHIIPVGKDRILITSPSKTRPAENHLTPDLITDEALNVNTDMVMLGGYIAYTKNFEAVFNRVINRIAEVNLERHAAGKPPVKLVMTAAAQPIAEMPTFQAFFKKASQTTDVILHANTGEFRRLMGADKEWREPHNHKWEGLGPHEMEAAKKADALYQADKQSANESAITTLALPMANATPHNLTFVVTNGSQGVYVINRDACEEYMPKPIDKVVNTIGAGDNFSGGWDLGEALNLSEEQKFMLASSFAAQVIQQDPPRLEQSAKSTHQTVGETIEVSGALATLPQNASVMAMLSAMKPAQRAI